MLIWSITPVDGCCWNLTLFRRLLVSLTDIECKRGDRLFKYPPFSNGDNAKNTDCAMVVVSVLSGCNTVSSIF